MAGAEITDQYRQPGPYRTLPTPVILFVAQQKGPLRHTLRPVFAEAMASRSDHLLPGHQPDRPFNRCRHSAMPMMRHQHMHEHRRTGHQHGYESDMSTQRHESRGKRNTTKIMFFVFFIVLVLFLPLFPKAPQRYAKAGFGSDKPTSRTQNPTLRAARFEKLLRPTVSGRAPGDSFYFAKSEIVESLLRRGVRCRRGLPLRRAGGASRHSALAIRARKQSLSARLRNPATSPRSLNAKPQASAPRPC